MEDKYSIAFIPDSKTSEEVKKLKLQLADEIGWYNSKNSLAHITICEFISTDKEIEIIKKKIARITKTFTPFQVLLNGFDSYPNGAFYISPSENSKKGLKKIMKSLTSSLIEKKMYKSNEPHLSIARKLSLEKLAIAHKLFQETELSFQCDKIFLRKFNPNIKQFEIINSFDFNSEPCSEGIQGTLF